MSDDVILERIEVYYDPPKGPNRIRKTREVRETIHAPEVARVRERVFSHAGRDYEYVGQYGDQRIYRDQTRP